MWPWKTLPDSTNRVPHWTNKCCRFDIQLLYKIKLINIALLCFVWPQVTCAYEAWFGALGASPANFRSKVCIQSVSGERVTRLHLGGSGWSASSSRWLWTPVSVSCESSVCISNFPFTSLVNGKLPLVSWWLILQHKEINHHTEIRDVVLFQLYSFTN